MQRFLPLFVGCLLFASNSFGQSYTLHLKSGEYSLPENYGRTLTFTEEEIVEGKIYRIVQFYEVPSQTVKDELKSKGIELLYYLPHKAYISSFPATVESNVLSNYGVRSIAPLQKEHKLTHEFLYGDFPAHATKKEGMLDVLMMYYKNLDPVKVLREVHNYELLYRYDFSNFLGLRIPMEDLDQLASLPFVYYIEAAPQEPQLDNYLGRGLHSSQMLDAYSTAGRAYTGAGVMIALGDDGSVGPHIDTDGRIDNSKSTHDCGGHGDHDAGTILGAGNLNPKYKGGAIGADMLVYANVNSCAGGSWPWTAILEAATTYTSHDVRLTSHSWSDGCNGGYSSLAVTCDQQVRQLPNLMHIFSAGNSGSSNCGYTSGWGNITGGIKTAKNMITVGAIRYNNDFASYSSKGPTKDGRLKPDLVAMGSGVMSTEEDNTYGPRTGTSHSCPMVTGVFAQLIDAYKQKNGGNEPESALIKAALLNSADDMYTAGPDFRFGYGRLDGLGAAKVIENQTYFSGQVAQGETKQHNITVPANTQQVKVMVYWNDYEGTANASVVLVNDINLKVTDPSSTSYDPWILDNTASASNLRAPATRGEDNLNNTEQVTIDNPAAGSYTIEINGKQIPQGPQTYYVAYEFIEDEILVTYPYGGEPLVPGEIEYIRWNAFGNSGTFDIEFSANNGFTWSTVASGLHDTTQFYEWTVPADITGRGVIRISRGGVSGKSPANFSIMGVPQNLNVKWACDNSFRLDWDEVSGATSYTVYLFGNKYMDSITTVTADFYVYDQSINASSNYWVSVKANGDNNAVGRRAIAIEKTPGTFSCPVAIDATIAEVFPSSGTLFDCQSSATMTIQVEVENAGQNPISNIPVYYKVDNNATVTETVTSTIQPGYTEVYSFTQTADLSGTGTYNINTWVDFPTDGNSTNDQNNVIVEVVASTTKSIPFTDDLESYATCTTTGCTTACTTVGDWTNEDNGSVDDIDWRTDVGGTASNGTGPEVDHTLGNANGEYLYLEASSCTLQTAMLVSPCIDIPSGKAAQLSFWYHMYGSTMGNLHVDVMANGVWENDVMFPITGDQGDQWKFQTVDLSAYTGKNINVRFRGVTGTDYQSDLAIDDINITDATTVRVIEQPFTVKVFPNPSKDIFNYRIENQNEENVNITLTDLRGRILFSVNDQRSTINNVIDLSNEANAVYFLHVRKGAQQYHTKLIKK